MWVIPVVGDKHITQQLASNNADLGGFYFKSDGDNVYAMTFLLDDLNMRDEVDDKFRRLLLVLGTVLSCQLSMGQSTFHGNDGRKSVGVKLAWRIGYVDQYDPIIFKKYSMRQNGICNDICLDNRFFDLISKLNKSDDIVRVFEAYKKDKVFFNLYKVYELIDHDLRPKSRGAKTIHNLVSSQECERFRRTANTAAVIGDDARHADKGWKPPTNPMDLSEAQMFIEDLVRKWLEHKGIETD